MRFTPHDYQLRAKEWVISHPRCLLFLDMGLGKSVVTLSAVAELLTHGEAERVLVVAPKKVAESTWSAEAAKWDHLGWLRVATVMGTPARREAALDEEADVWVVGRDSLPWLEETMRRQGRPPFDMIVLDELTSFKNPRSLRFKALRRMTPGAHRVVGLTGTPTPNGLKDLWGQVYCIDSGARLGRFVTHYREKYFHCIQRNNIIIRMTPKAGAEEEILELIGDIAITMRAEDYLHLPDFLEEDVRVMLPEKSLKAYRKFERERIDETLRGAGGKASAVSAASAAALTGKLSQWANGAIYADDGAVLPLHEAKLEMMEELLEGAPEENVLVFYQYEHDRDRILSRFARLAPRVYSGDEDLRDWNAGRIRMLLAHPASTAYGLNMQAGGRWILWFSTGWNLELYQQANARLYRQGQTRPVMVHRLISAGTVDERMAEALAGKGFSQSELIRRLAEVL
ncbi:MAG: DEAD/DEAH box helicase [Bacteroides sp.]|nr:DEAD/DEAH box helicase [Bacteroides sp.]